MSREVRKSQSWHVKSIHDPHYIETIARLRAIREHQGISQSELAKRLGKPQSFVSKIETYERRMDLIEALEICRALGVGIQAIIPTELRYLVEKKDF